MAILNLLARSNTQMFLTNVELRAFAAHMYIRKTLNRGPSTFALWKEWAARGGSGGWPLATGEVYK